MFKINSPDFPGGPAAKTALPTQGAPGSIPGQGLGPTGLPHAATMSSHAATKDPACHK